MIPVTDSVGENKNIKVELKVPSDPTYTGINDKSTGWMDVVSPYDDTQDLTVDGAGLYDGSINTRLFWNWRFHS